MFQGKRRLVIVASALSVLGIAALAFVLIFGNGLSAHAAGVNKASKLPGKARFLSEPPSGTVSPNAVTIPNWGANFTDPTNEVTYPYSMVGTNPFTGSASTTVPTEIIPMRFVFDGGIALDGASKTAATIDSPVFNSAADIGAAANATASAPPGPPVSAVSSRPVNEPSDSTQVGDAFMRAQFNKVSPGYHVLLGAPTVLPTQTISVPKNQAVLLQIGPSIVALMSYTWFSARLKNLLVSLHTSSQVLPIFLVYNTFLYTGNDPFAPGACCILGYHGATSSANGNGKQQVQTYMFASYSDPDLFFPNDGDSISYIQDIHALSHEVTEWLDDPFVNNAVNPWLTPTAPQYGCTSDLETGDPVVGFGFIVTEPSGASYHPEDEVFFSWFARQNPSISSAGYYTYLNNFAGVAQGCS